MACTSEFWRRPSPGYSCVGIAGLYSWSRASTPGCSCVAGTTVSSVGCAWQFWIVSVETWARRWLHWGVSMTQLVQMFVWCQYKGVPMLLWRHTSTSWAAGISRSWSNTHCSICASSNVVFKRLRLVFLVLWTRTPWQSSSWTDWRGQRVATGWLLDLRWRRPSWLVVSRCPNLLMSWPILWECGPWSWRFWRKQGEKTTVIVLWYDLPFRRFVATASYPCILIFGVLEERDRWVFLSRSARPLEISYLPHAAWNLWVCLRIHPCSSWEGAHWLEENVLPPREHTSVAPWRFHVCFWAEIEHGRETLVGAINRRPVYNTCFCFSCQQFRPSTIFRWLWVLRLWWSLPFRVLSSAED